MKASTNSSSCANRRFAGTTVPEHFAQTGPALGGVVRAGPVPVHFSRDEPFFGDFARAVALTAQLWTGPEVLLHGPERCSGIFRNLCLGHLERTVQTRPVPAHLSRASKLGTAIAHYFPFSGRRIQRRQQFRRWSPRLKCSCRPTQLSRSKKRRNLDFTGAR